MPRWVCPLCEREFGHENQGHVCVPGGTVDDSLARRPEHKPIYDAIISHLRTLGRRIPVSAALIGLASLTAIWVRSEVLDTSRYVETVAPLASDPAIQAAVSARLSQEIVTRLDIQGYANDLVKALEQRGAPQRLGDLVPPIV